MSSWSTVVMIIEPPGDPRRARACPSRRRSSGDIELRGRLPPSARFGCVSESKLKSVSSLLSRKPQPGTTMPLPPVDSIVNVYATTLPQGSETVRCVVEPSPAAVDAGPAPAAVVARVSRLRDAVGR